MAISFFHLAEKIVLSAIISFTLFACMVVFLFFYFILNEENTPDNKEIVDKIIKFAQSNGGLLETSVLGDRVCMIPSWRLSFPKKFLTEQFKDIIVPDWLENLDEGRGWLLVIEKDERWKIFYMNSKLYWNEPEEDTYSVVCPDHLIITKQKFIQTIGGTHVHN